MDKIRRIYQEIERLKEKAERRPHATPLEGFECMGKIKVCNELLSFLHTIMEESDKNLDEAAEDFAEGEWDGLHDTNGNALYTEDYIKYTFIAGAEWQKGQMLKNAVETEVWSYSSDEDLRAIPLFGIDKFNNLKDGDKVKVIVLKEEE